MSVRWVKLRRDLDASSGRFIAVTVAIALGVAAFSTLLVARSMLIGAVTGNYVGSRPASAQIELDRIDDALLARLRRDPMLAAVEAGASVQARVRSGSAEWLPLRLFVVSDFANWRVNTVAPTAGDWPPADGALLIERSAMSMLGARIGHSLDIDLPGARQGVVRLAGEVHDPGLAPAWQEQTVYAYASATTVAALGGDPTLNLLKVVVAEGGDDATAISARMRELARELAAGGHVVHEIRVPPPNLHPHQAQMTAVLSMLAAFSALVLLLSAVLAATTMTAFLAQQVRQIAVMKAIGARSSQIGTLYALPVLLIGVLAVACGLPLGVSAGRGFANAVAQLLNLRLLAAGPPWSVLLAAAVPGILAPLLAAAWPIVQATRSSVRSALADSAIARDSARAGTFARRLGRLGVGDIALTLALRNSLRRRGRLLLNVILLGVAGALFINCLGMRWAWQDDIAQAALARHYDIEVQLLRPASIQHLQDALAPIAGITAIESWDTVGVGIDSGQAFTVVRSYPDGGHGVLNLRATPPGSRFIDHPLLAGRWLREDDVDAVVLNTGASRGLLGGARVGDRIALRVDDRPVSVQVVGIVQQTMSPAAIHISPAGFAQAVARPGRTAVLRIALADRSGVESAGAAVVERLERAGSAVKLLMTERRFAAAQGGHILVLVYALATIAILMAAVGLLGLASALGTSVVERIREFGVMRALGARSAQIRRSLLAEGVIVCLLSVLLSIVLVLPLASIVGRLLARISAQPLAWLPGPSAVLAWTCLVLPCALLASWWPAQRASTWQIRETLGVS